MITPKRFYRGLQSDPTDYYGIRSGQLLKGAEIYDPNPNLTWATTELRTVGGEAWLRSTFKFPAETDLSGLVDLQTNPRIQRIQAYWELSLFSQAVNEAELLRSDCRATRSTCTA